MSIAKRLSTTLSLLFLVLVFFLSKDTTAWAVQEPQINGEAAIVIELHSGQVIWAKNEHERRPPASTTKIITALLALEKGNLNEQVQISAEAVRVAGTRVYLTAGEKQSLEDLLYAMLLNSANDAAYAIAEHIGGSVEEFAEMMNEKAKELGAVDSNFVTPNGLPADNHYSTAFDLAIIARSAMQNAKFREIVATKTRDWHGAEWESKLINQNKLLTSYEGAIGVKNGYTNEAKMCLVAAAARNGDTYLSVMLGSSGNNVWTDSQQLLDYAFTNYYTQSMVVKGEVVAELEYEEQKLQIVPAADFTYLQSRAEPINPQGIVKLLPLKAPVHKGEKVGELQYTWQGQEIGRVELVALNDLRNRAGLYDWWVRLSSVVCILMVVVMLIKYYNRRRTRRYMTFSRRSRY